MATTCPFCSSTRSSWWASEQSRPMLRCHQCAVVFFQRPLEARAKYDDYYPYLSEFTPKRYRYEVRIRRRALRHQLAEVRALNARAHDLLDVGAGPGYLCTVAAEEGFRARGAEISKPAVEAGQAWLGVEYVSFETLAPQSFDVIFCQHILEHLEEPAEFLAKIKTTLRPGGLLVVHVPNQEPLSFLMRNVLRRALGRERLTQLYYPEHITGFDETSLPRALAYHGFQCIKVCTPSMWSKYHDPFFLRNYFQTIGFEWRDRVDYVGLVRHVIRSVIDNVGGPLGRGAWVVGFFRALS